MDVQKIRLVYFSPTKTTKTILESIAGGMGVDLVKHDDLTLPDDNQPIIMEENELLIVGAPVYTGRIPEIAVHRFQRLKSDGNPAVIVAVYGNREYDDALLELHDIAVEAGFVPIAAGAFIGEHSFSSASIHIARGRPDAADIRQAQMFGKAISECLRGVRTVRDVLPINLPGNRPFRERSVLPKISPVTENQKCYACGKCASACPTGSIALNGKINTDTDGCILCCACIKICPENARIFQDPWISQIMEWLRLNTAERKEPEAFVGEIGFNPAPNS